MKPSPSLWAWLGPWLLLCQLLACSSPSSSPVSSTSGAEPPVAATVAVPSPVDLRATDTTPPGLRPGASEPGASPVAAPPMEPSLRLAMVQAQQAEAT